MRNLSLLVTILYNGIRIPHKYIVAVKGNFQCDPIMYAKNKYIVAVKGNFQCDPIMYAKNTYMSIYVFYSLIIRIFHYYVVYIKSI